MSKKNHQRQLAAAKARKQQRQATDLVQQRFIASPWKTWREVRELAVAGELSRECVTIVEHLPYLVNGSPITLAKTADIRGLPVEKAVKALENLERNGYLMWVEETNSVALVATEEQLAEIRAEELTLQREGDAS